MFALSVSISTSSSPTVTSSPSDFSHFRIVPSSMESDRRGIATSAMPASMAAMIVPGHAAASLSRGGLELGHRGQGREAGHRPAAPALLDPDPPAVALDDLAADREPDAGPLVGLAVVQPLEHLEHPLAVGGLD